MKILNPGKPVRRIKRRLAPPELFPYRVREQLYLLDAHTLDLRRIEPRTLQGLRDAAEAVAPRPAPVWPRKTAFGPCRSLVLNLTHACNLRCVYCFVHEQTERRDRPVRSMPMEMALGAIEALFPTTENRGPAPTTSDNRVIRQGPRGAGPSVSFFGGEPLLAWDVLRAVTERVRADFPRAQFHVTTNGTLLTAERAAWCAARGFSFIVSLDGDPARHDRMRPLPDGTGSHAAAFAGLRHLAANGIRPTLRSTFTAEGLNLVEELERLNALCDDGLGRWVSIEPVSLTEGCAAGFGEHALTPDRLRALEPQYLAAADWAIARARAGKPFRWHHLNKTLERLIQKVPHCSECGAGNGYLTVTPEGEIHACHREKSRVGRLERDGDAWRTVFDGEDRAPWLDNRLEIHQRCPSCPMRYICGGGCRQDNLDRAGDVRRPDPLYCELTRLRLLSATIVLDTLGPDLAALAAGVKR